MMKRTLSFTPIFLILALFTLDIVQWLTGWSSSLSLFIWLLFAVIVAAWVLQNTLSWLLIQREFKEWIGIGLGLACVAVLLYPTFRFFSESYMLHTEAAQQGECAYRRYSTPELRDTLMYSWCFLGYNTRQYVFQALLTDALGPGSVALNLPYVFHFVLGLVSFWIALEKLVSRGLGNRALLLTVLVLPAQSFYYFFLSNAYEQSFFPYCHALLAYALLIECYLEFRTYTFGVFLIALLWLLFSYTPALGVYFFLVGMFSLWIWFAKPFPKFNRMASLGFGLFSLVYFGLSLLYRTDIRLLPDPKFHSYTFSEGMERILPSVFSTAITGTDSFSNLYCIFIFFLALLLTFTVKKYRWMSLLAIVWAVSHLLISAFSKGYAAPMLPFSLHRAIPIFPVLGLVIFYGFGSLRERLSKASFVGITGLVLVVHLVTGGLRADSFFGDFTDHFEKNFSSGTALLPIWRSLPDRNLGGVILGALFRTESPLGQFTDATRYFFPNMTVTKKMNPNERPGPEINTGLPVLFIGESSEAERFMQELRADPAHEVNETIRFFPHALGHELSAFTFRYRL